MTSFPKTFWTRFQDFKDSPALYTVDDGDQRHTVSFWEWTRRIQNLAMALMDAGFDAGTRMGFVAPNCRDWIDMAMANWLVGGCLVPLDPEMERQQMLHCLGRSGCEWIVVADDAARNRLRGPGGQLPSHLQWALFDGDDGGDHTHIVEQMEQSGRHLVRRGHTKKLARRIYELKQQAPALILFDPDPDDDSEGALFSGRKVGLQLDRIAHQMGVSEDTPTAVAPAMSMGHLSAFLLCTATLYAGCPVALPEPGGADHQLKVLEPTLVVCDRDFLRDLARRWKQQLDSAPDLLKKLADSDESDAPAISRAIGRLGEKAARKLLYEPIRDDFGSRLEALHVFEGRCPVGLAPILDGAGISLRGHFGIAEAGITHVEHPDAHRPDSCGRPIEGIATKLLDTKTGDAGELCVRGDTLFDDYWAGEGARGVDDDGWLHTGRVGRLESGFLFLED